MQLNLEVPINAVSFGSISISILRDLYERGLNPNIFPIGNPDLSAQNLPEDFVRWLQNCVNKAARCYKRSYPTLRLWHLNGSHGRLSDKTVLLTFYECDNPTETELNIIKNTDKVLFTCDYTTNIFKDYGSENVFTIPLGFDKWNFFKKDKQYFNDRVIFNVVGKWEHRKRTEKIIRTIARKWGNNRGFHFQCAVYNPFFKPEDNQKLFIQAVEGKQYFNIQFLGFMQQNSLYNDFLNSANAVLGMSGSENWGLPEFQSVAIGKHAVIHDVTGYKEWANQENSVLVKPSSKIPSSDGMFFQKDAPFNQGNFFDWSEDNFIAGVEECIERIKNYPVNTKGLELQEKFSVKKMVDSLLLHLTN